VILVTPLREEVNRVARQLALIPLGHVCTRSEEGRGWSSPSCCIAQIRRADALATCPFRFSTSSLGGRRDWYVLAPRQVRHHKGRCVSSEGVVGGVHWLSSLERSLVRSLAQRRGNGPRGAQRRRIARAALGTASVTQIVRVADHVIVRLDDLGGVPFDHARPRLGEELLVEVFVVALPAQ
jgi:hypothetical protein